MKYRNVGKAGIKVSEIALGSWMTDLKESSEEDVAKEVVKLAYENGINFFDCADAYSGGAAERLPSFYCHFSDQRYNPRLLFTCSVQSRHLPHVPAKLKSSLRRRLLGPV